MATETVKVENGNLIVTRSAPGKDDLEVSLSDVESVSFERGGEGEGQSDGTLILFTKDNRYTVRIADNEAGKYLKLIYDGAENSKAKQKPASKQDSGEVVSKP